MNGRITTVVYRLADGKGTMARSMLGLALEWAAKPVAIVTDGYVLELETDQEVIDFTQRLTRIASEEWFQTTGNISIIYEHSLGEGKFALATKKQGEFMIKGSVTVGIAFIRKPARSFFLAEHGPQHSYEQVLAYILTNLDHEDAAKV